MNKATADLIYSCYYFEKKNNIRKNNSKDIYNNIFFLY